MTFEPKSYESPKPTVQTCNQASAGLDVQGCDSPWGGSELGDNFENGWGNGGISAIAGYPHITIPLDYIDGMPTGVSFMGTAWDEVNLLNIAYAFEQENKFFPRPTRDKN